MRIAAYTPDLMDRSKISAAASACGHELTYVGSPEALVGLAGVDTVVVDLSKQGVPAALADIVAGGCRVIAYGSHVDTALLDAARHAGVTPADVLPRSKFFADVAAALS